MSTALILIASVVIFASAALVWSNTSTSANVLAAAVFVAILLLRPAILGEAFGPIGVVVVFIALIFVCRPDLRRLPALPGRQGLALGVCLVYPIVASGSTSSSTFAGLLVTPAVAAAGVAAGFKPKCMERFVNLTVLVAIHQAVALVAATVFQQPSWTYTSTGSARIGWEFQISGLGAVTVGSGGLFPLFEGRLSGPFGEPGVFACFLAIIAAIDLGLRARWRWRCQIPLLTAIALTQSIAGLGVYFGGLTVFFLLRFRPLQRFAWYHYVVLFAALWGALWAAVQPDGLLQPKATANAESVRDRLYGTAPLELLESWLRHPLGIASSGNGSAINLWQASIAYGPLVLVAGVWLYSASLRGCHPGRAAPAVAGLLLTCLFAQPPFLYSWIFLSFAVSGGTLASSNGEPGREPKQGGRLRGTTTRRESRV